MKTSQHMGRCFAALLGASAVLWQSSASAISIPVEDDNIVNETSGATSNNYGRRTVLDVYGTASNNRWVYINFGNIVPDLPSGITGNSVVRATLYLYVNDVIAAGSMDGYAVSASWVEGTQTAGAEVGSLSWSIKPASTGSAIAGSPFSIAAGDEGEYVGIPVTALVKDWVDTPANNHGIVFKPNGTAIRVEFESKESTTTSHAPILEVILDSVPDNANLSAVAGGTWTGASSITTLGTIGTGTWNGTSIALANGGTGSTTASGARANLGLTIGTNVQAWDADIDDLADGSLTGSKVGSGISASNVTTGTLAVPNGGTGTATGSITGTGALTFTAGGSNTSITLTPNGTGVVVLSSDATVNGIAVGRGGGGVSTNSAIGYSALFSNTAGGIRNTSVGYNALTANTTGDDNVAIGHQALWISTTGFSNTAVGTSALYNNTTGYVNTAVGLGALVGNSEGLGNTAAGVYALQLTTTGDNNVGLGYLALANNTTGSDNVAIGIQAGRFQADGSTELVPNNSVYIGAAVKGFDNDDQNSIVIGPQAVGKGANTTVIGNTGTSGAYIYGIHGATAASGVAVYVNSSGRLGTLTSSRRFKDDIADMDAASEAIHSLRPVSFHYKPELDAQGIPQFGLIAEEVAEIAPELVARDAQGDIYTVRYEAVNAMLLNEFQKEHQRVKEQAEKLAEQEQAIAAQERANSAQQKQIEELTAMMSELNRRVRKADKR